MVGRARATGWACRDIFVQVCPAARLALVEIGMRWRGGVMPNLQSCKLRHLLKISGHLRARCTGDDVSTAKSIAIEKTCV